MLVLAVGCGEEEPISLSEYRDRANAICLESNTDEKAELLDRRAELEADGELDRDEVQELNREVLERARESTDLLVDIPPPDEGRADADTYEQRVQDANDAFEDMIEAFEDGDDERAAEALDRNEARIEEAKEAATGLGLDECAAS
jgi:hypothetical protein